MTRRLLFVNRYFHPDHSATSQIASALAFHLASRGWEVVAITSRQRYDDPGARLASEEQLRGVHIVRVPTTRFGRAGLAGRAIDYATFYLSAFFAIRRHEHESIVVAMTDPPLISVIAAAASRHTVNWVQDLFPDVAAGLGMTMPRFLHRLRDWSLRRARANVVLGERMAVRVPNATVIHNWADDAIHPVDRSSNALRREWGLEDRFVAGYSGNLGRAHEFETILGAMHRLPEIDFLITGGGARLEAVKSQAGANVTFRPYQPQEKLAESLSASDVHLVSLQPQLEGLVQPSKFYGALAAGRPVIFIGARDGELARIIDEHRCGVVVESGDVDGLALALRQLAGDRTETAEMGRRGRDLYCRRFASAHAFASWERLLETRS